MIDVRVLDMRPHPDQATNNPGCWAVQLRVEHAGRTRTFWRWFTIRETRGDTPSTRKPTPAEVLAQFWEDTFCDLHGFDFERAEDATRKGT